VAADDDWQTVYFPHLRTLDLRRMVIATEDDDHYMWKLNDRSSEMLLPLGRKSLTPSLHTLRISASDIGSLDIGDFTELADQITDLSLGVYTDDGFLEPKLLDKFSALTTFEMDWPLHKDDPFYQLKASGSPLKVLRIRDRHSRPLTEEVWEKLSDEDDLHLEWTPEPERSPQQGGNGTHARASEESDSEEEDPSDEELDEDYMRSARIERIAERLETWIGHFPDLQNLILPLKFGPALADEDEDFDYQDVGQLVATCEELGVDINLEERHWETDLTYKRFEKPGSS
jgi:hypothetical protein